MEPGAKDGDLPPLTHDADAGNTNAKGREQMKRKAEHETQCIRSESEVPSGYVPMLDFGDSTSYPYKRLSKAQQEGLVRAVKLVRTTKDFVGGRVWVHEADARSHLLVQPRPEPSRQQPKADTARSDSRIESAVIALCEINNGITLMHGLLERLTAAVESIATQPQASQQEVLGHISSNGFHN